MDWIGPLIDQHGVSIIYLIVLLYIAQTIKPSGLLQSQIVGLAQKSMDLSEKQDKRLDSHESESKERNHELLGYLRNQDTLTAKALQAITDLANNLGKGQSDLRSGQQLLIGAMDGIAKSLRDTHVVMGEAAKEMTVNDLNSKIDELIELLRGVDSKLDGIKQEFIKRIEPLEDDVRVAKKQVAVIQARITDEQPIVTARNKTTTVSKSQARAQESQDSDPAPPQESHDKPLNDVPPAGG